LRKKLSTSYSALSN